MRRLALSAALILVGISVPFFFPKPLLKYAAKTISEKTPVRIQTDDISGTLWSGLVFDRLRVEIPEAKIYVERLKVGLEWSKLFRKTISFEPIEISGPRIVVSALKKPEKAANEKSAWLIQVSDVRVTDGRVEIRGPGGSAVVKNIDVALSARSGKIEISSAQANLDGRWQGARIAGRVTVNQGRAHWTLTVSSGGLQGSSAGEIGLAHLDFNASLVATASSETMRQWTGDSNAAVARIHMEGTPAAHRLSLELRSTDYALSAAGSGSLQGNMWSARWSRLDMHAPQNWRAARPFTTDVAPRFFRLSGLDLKAPVGSAALSGVVRFPSPSQKMPEFNFQLAASGLDLSSLANRSAVRVKTSRLNANLAVSNENGTFAARGPLVLTAEEIRFGEQGPTLKNAVVELQGTGSRLLIRRGEAESARKGKMTLAGSIGKSDIDVRLLAKDFEFQTDVGLSGKTTIDLALTGSLDEPFIAGDVNILKADYRPDQKKKPPPRPPEADQASHDAPSSLAMDVRVHFDNDVWYKEQQTAIEAKGDLNARKNAYEAPTLIGKIETIRGNYIFYGRAFKIEQGIISFEGEARLNPSLEARAVYVEEQSKTKITLTMTGTMEQPTLALSSDPPLDQTDIISVLVTGKPMDDIGNGNAGNQSASQDLAKTVVANYFAEKIRQRLQFKTQIDVLQFNLDKPDEANLTVGKNLSKRLYVAYGQTLGPNGESRVEAQYSLGHFWNLEGTTATEGKYVIDLLYLIGFK